MPYVKPDVVVDNMIQAGFNKAKLSIRDLFIRGALSGALLGFATTLAFTANAQTGVGIVGAVIFPVGFVMIVLLGWELVTGNFALVPLGAMDGKIRMVDVWFNWSWVFAGNLVGSILYAILFAKILSAAAPLAKMLVSASEAKTFGYAKLGADGMLIAFIKAVLCNWMVTLGVVMSLTSQSTVGKIVAMCSAPDSSRARSRRWKSLSGARQPELKACAVRVQRLPDLPRPVLKLWAGGYERGTGCSIGNTKYALHSELISYNRFGIFVAAWVQGKEAFATLYGKGA